MFNLSKNPRVIISMESLAEAFFRLLQDKAYEEVTIIEICEKAGVTRKTFYRNFETKDDLFDYYIYQVINIDFPKADNLSLRESMKNFFSYFENAKPLLKICKKNYLFGLLLDRIIKYLELSSNFSEPIKDVKDILVFGEYYWRTITSIQVKMLEVWTERDFVDTVDELVIIFMNIIKKIGQIETN